MVNYNQNACADGVKAAQKAIANGVPRWVQTSERPFGQMIHPETGLPIALAGTFPRGAPSQTKTDCTAGVALGVQLSGR